jgi:hypothetical protein
MHVHVGSILIMLGAVSPETPGASTDLSLGVGVILMKFYRTEKKVL